jgi:hypothetical protein
MQNASLSEIKKELQLLNKIELSELCIKLAKYKKDNKEFLHYLLFNSINEDVFIYSVKDEITKLFSEIKNVNSYPAKKSIRKILRLTNKYIKYSGKPATQVQLLLFYCHALKQTKISFYDNVAIANLYQNQIKKVKNTLAKMHEDFQFDYQSEIEELEKI